MIIRSINLNKKIKEGYCFFDIETSGFSPKNSIVTSLSYTLKGPDTSIVRQIMLEDPEEEILLLSSFLRDVKEASCMVSFNGDRFDIPFILKRAEVFKIKNNLTDKGSLDLYKYLKKNSSLTGLASCGQKEVEKMIGFERPLEMNGKDAVDAFKEFIKKRDSKISQRLLDYNLLDVKGLIEIFDLYLKTEDQKTIALKLDSKTYPFKLEQIKRKHDIMALELKGHTPLPFDIDIKKGNYRIEASENALIVTLELVKGLLDEETVGYCFKSDFLPSPPSPYKLKDGLIALEAGKTRYDREIVLLLKKIIEDIFK